MRGGKRENDNDREAITRERETCNTSDQGRDRGGKRENDNGREATRERERDMQHK